MHSAYNLIDLIHCPDDCLRLVIRELGSTRPRMLHDVPLHPPPSYFVQEIVTVMLLERFAKCSRILSRRKPVAGVKNIITFGFGVRGQVDLIDFQSMPDGSFKFLLNYIDHGVKILTCIPLVANQRDHPPSHLCC